MARYPAKQKCQLRGVLYCYYLLDIVISTLFNGRLSNKNITISKNSKQSKSGNNNNKKIIIIIRTNVFVKGMARQILRKKK